MSVRRIDYEDRGRLKRDRGPLWVVERNLRMIFERNQTTPWEIPDVVHEWIVQKDDPVVWLDRVAAVVLAWSIDPTLAPWARSAVETVNDSLDRWRRELRRNAPLAPLENDGESCYS